MAVVTPKAEFTLLTEAQIEEALNDTSDQNPIAHEIARLIAAYTENFRAHCQQIGRIPDSILRATPSCPIEGVAMKLMTQAIKEELARQKLH